MQDVRRWGDRVARQEEVALREFRGSDESERGRLVPRDVSVRPWLEVCRRNAIVRVEDLCRLTECVSRIQRALVRLSNCIFPCKLLGDPLLRCRHGALVEPEHDTECEEVLGELNLLTTETEPFTRARDHSGHGDLKEVVPLQ